MFPFGKKKKNDPKQVGSPAFERPSYKNEEPEPLPVDNPDAPVAETVGETSEEAAPLVRTDPADESAVRANVDAKADAKSADPAGSIPSDLTFARIVAMMSIVAGNDSDTVYVTKDEHGCGQPYHLNEALLKYGACRVRDIMPTILNGTLRMVYQIIQRDVPIGERLRVNPRPLPYDLPCWRPGCEATLWLDQDVAVPCRVVGGHEDQITIITDGGTIIDDVPVDRLFLNGVDPDADPLPDSKICEILRNEPNA